MITGIVAITAFCGAWMIWCSLAQSVGPALSTVDVYKLDGTIADYSGEALRAMATRRGALEQLDVRALITREFEQYDPAYLAHKASRAKRLDALKRKLVSCEEAAKVLACSRRMIAEAEWLLVYTAEWPKLDQQLAAIEASLATKDQDFAVRQTPDGSWGACFEAWFEKIDGSVDLLGDVRPSGDGSHPKLPYPFENTAKGRHPGSLDPVFV